MKIKHCPTCGAVLSGPPVDFAAIPGAEYAKRALEIAASGGHTITFVGRETAQQLAAFAANLGLDAWHIQRCPCGNYLDPLRECRCKPAQILRYRAGKRACEARQADLVIEVAEPSVEELTRWAGGLRGEAWSTVEKRLQAAQDRPEVPAELNDETVRALYRAAVQQLGRVPNSALQVAATIARLAGEPCLSVTHLAEAIQYRPRPDST